MPDPRFIGKLFDVCRSRGVIVAPFLLAIVTSCHRTRPELGVKIQAASPGVIAFFNANFNGAASVVDIPGYNDEQRLPGNGNNDYGDTVRLYVAPSAPTQTQLNAGAIVALIEVLGDANGGKSLGAYNRLKINDIGGNGTSLYCVLLKSGNQAGSYDGYVTPVQNGTVCTPIGDQYKLSAEVDVSESVSPYTARFVEDVNGMPAIGVGCLAGNPPAFVFCHLGRGVGMGKKALGDEQDLAIPAPGSTPPVSRSSIRGKITPVTPAPAFGTTPVKAAIINLSAAPPKPSRYFDWGLGPNDNGVWISKTVAGTWWAQFVPGTASPTNQPMFPVTWTGHATPVPVSARWLWSDTDENAWVACDQGCCTISGLTGESRNDQGHNRP
jgi:hypothetical protein